MFLSFKNLSKPIKTALCRLKPYLKKALNVTLTSSAFCEHKRQIMDLLNLLMIMAIIVTLSLFLFCLCLLPGR